MRLFINGNQKEFPEPSSGGLTVKSLLNALKLKPEAMAFELNLEIVPKKDYDSRLLKEGDKIEIISFVGGG